MLNATTHSLIQCVERVVRGLYPNLEEECVHVTFKQVTEVVAGVITDGNGEVVRLNLKGTGSTLIGALENLRMGAEEARAARDLASEVCGKLQ